VTNPDFYTNYLNVLIIEDLGAGKKGEGKAGGCRRGMRGE